MGNAFKKTLDSVILMQSKNALAKCTLFLSIILIFSFSQSEDICASNTNDCKIICSEYNSIIITSINTIIDIKNINEIFVDEIFSIQNSENTSVSELEINLYCDYQNLTIDDGDEELDFETSESTGIITTILKETLTTNESTYLHFSYMLITEIPRAEGEPAFYYFQFEKFYSYFTYEHIISVRLPSRSFIHDFEYIPNSFTPVNASIIPSGNRLYLTWEFSNKPQNSIQEITVWFNEPIGEKTPIYVFIIGPIFGVCFGSIVVYWLMRRREKMKINDIEMVYLSENQKMLLKVIGEKEKRLQQKELLEVTGFSKTKISRNLAPLEEKGLIVKEKWGREFIVFITEKGKRVIK